MGIGIFSPASTPSGKGGVGIVKPATGPTGKGIGIFGSPTGPAKRPSPSRSARNASTVTLLSITIGRPPRTARGRRH